MAQLKATSLNDTGSLTIPAGNQAQRPGSPTAGAIRYNSTRSKQEVWNGDIWEGVPASIETFMTPGTCSWVCPPGVTAVQVLVVGGGGGGGGGHDADWWSGAGGGAGGVVYHPTLVVTPGSSYTLTVGAGGVGGGCSDFGSTTGGSALHETMRC